MDSVTLEQIIRQYVQLDPPNQNGWCSVRCHVCNDHTRKGNRGAFLFDHDKIVYKCWNCFHVSTYDPNEHEYIPKSMITTLDAFGVPDKEWKQVILDSPAYRNGGITKKVEKSKLGNIDPKIIELPSFFFPLKGATCDLSKKARQYLIEARGVDPDSYPFMLAKKPDNPRLFKWLGRVIMPVYKNNNLVYYIGRALFNAEKKYETPATPKERVLYGFDRLFEHTDTPLLINEGWFDAHVVDGVATLGNVITPYQIEWLNRSRREKVYIPDKFGDGLRAAEQAVELGWSIATPDIGSSCKDMNDAVKKYGKMYVMKEIMRTKTSDDFEALTQLRNYCDS